MPEDTKKQIINKALLRFGPYLYETDFSKVRPYYNEPTFEMYNNAKYLTGLLPNLKQLNFTPITGSNQFSGIYDVPDNSNYNNLMKSIVGSSITQDEKDLMYKFFGSK